MKKRVALITYSGLPEGAESERLLLPHLVAAGIEATIIDWSVADFDFSQFGLLILRACWDYHLRLEEFMAWLKCTAKAVSILNPLETVLWNHNKFYLRELQSQGVLIAPTVFVGESAMSSGDWAAIRSWQKVVVKPAVSATAHNTWLTESALLAPEKELKQEMLGQPFLVQQFLPEISTEGELSFIYLNGTYSHTVLKRPAMGDFRVQKDFGGSAELFYPPDSLLKQADAIANSVPMIRESLCCRIDAVVQAGKLVLMEVELIEPELFLTLAEGSAQRLAKAIAGRLAK